MQIKYLVFIFQFLCIILHILALSTCTDGQQNYNGDGSNTYYCNCVAGMYYTRFYIVTASGNALSGSKCWLCGVGVYSTASDNFNSCMNCDAGKYNAQTGASGCYSCPADSYSNSGASSCTNCPFGSVSPAASSVSSACTCITGFTGPAGGPCVTTIEACPVGRYGTSSTTETVSSATVSCTGSCCYNLGSAIISDGQGDYINNNVCQWWIAATAADVVVTVLFSYVEIEDGRGKNWDWIQICGSTTCVNTVIVKIDSSLSSPTVYYSSTSMMYIKFKTDQSVVAKGFEAQWTVCSACPANSNSIESRKSITDCVCNAGFTGNSGGPCIRDICAPGYAYVGRQSSSYGISTEAICQACVPGKYKLAMSNGDCTSCIAGTYSSVVGSKLGCDMCPWNTGASCIGCTALTECTCDAGYTGFSATTCTACGVGTFKSSHGFVQTSACVKCGVGKYTSILGATTCTACETGKISTQNGSLACTQCPTGTTSAASRTHCVFCADGTEVTDTGTCMDCPQGKFSNSDTNRLCKACVPGFYTSVQAAPKCTPCRACPDGHYRVNCSPVVGGGICLACPACGEDEVNVGCMNRRGHTDEKGVCRRRKYLSRTPLCDEKDGGYGLGGYTFLQLFGVSQDDSSFQCRHRCDNEQNILSDEMYTDPETLIDLRRQFPDVNVDGKYIRPAFNGGYCNGPYACDVSNCNIQGSADDSQTAYQLKFACPLYIDQTKTQEFWTAVALDPTGTLVSHVDAMRQTKCQTCAVCGQDPMSIADWGRGCARECTQLQCQNGLIFDWTEAVAAAKCKTCGELDDVRVCLSSEQRAFDGLDVSGRLPKFYMTNCMPKREIAPRGYSSSYGNCVQCMDYAEDCVSQDDTYYHTCAEDITGIVPVCKSCLRANGREPVTSRYWDGQKYHRLYCQQRRCPVLSGKRYTGLDVQHTPHRLCREECESKTCEGDASRVKLPCVLPHQERCKDAVDMNKLVNDVSYGAVGHAPAHVNMLEPATDALFLFASFENLLVSTQADKLYQRAQCVWNADFIPDNNMNPGGVSSRFQHDCRPWTRDARTLYPLMPLQNTVEADTADETAFSRRVLLNTSAHAVAYAQDSIERPPGVFTGDVYLKLNLINTNNATLAVFVPDDRGIVAATWVPRWRVSVHARQISGGDMTIAVSHTVTSDNTPIASQDYNCLSCFSLRLL